MYRLVPGFAAKLQKGSIASVDVDQLPLAEGQSVDEFCAEIFPVIFDRNVMPKRVNQANGEDLVLTSACNYYDGVTQAEAEAFYDAMKNPADAPPISFGLNSRLVKKNGVVTEEVYKVGGLYS